MVDFGKSDKMINICGNAEKLNTVNGLSNFDIAFFIKKMGF